MGTFKTKGGTELPMLNLKGKDYLEVKWRLVWFREDHPDWGIETSVLVSPNGKSTLAEAIIKNADGRIMAMGHKVETADGFPDHTEKSETSAIGRALALCGYGTQFAPELDEGDRLADSPVEKVRTIPMPHAKAAAVIGAAPQPEGASYGDYVVTFGKKYMGRKIKDIPREEIGAYLDWLFDSSAKKNQAPHTDVTLLQDAVSRYYSGSAPRPEDDIPF